MTLNRNKPIVVIENNPVDEFYLNFGVRLNDSLSTIFFYLTPEVIIRKFGARGNIITRLKQVMPMLIILLLQQE